MSSHVAGCIVAMFLVVSQTLICAAERNPQSAGALPSKLHIVVEHNHLVREHHASSTLQNTRSDVADVALAVGSQQASLASLSTQSSSASAAQAEKGADAAAPAMVKPQKYVAGKGEDKEDTWYWGSGKTVTAEGEGSTAATKGEPGKSEDSHEKEEELELSAGVAEQEHKAGFVAGVMLITNAMALMGLMFLLNYPDPQVQSYSWKLLSHIISILCALMFEKSQDHLLIKGLIIPFFGLEHGLNQLWNFIPFVTTYFALGPLCYISRNRPNVIFAAENIVAHLAAFICVEMYDEPLAHIAHQQGLGGHLLVYCLAPASCVAMFWMLSTASDLLCATLKLEGEESALDHLSLEHIPEGTHHHVETGAFLGQGHDHSWKHCMKAAQGESLAIVFGFLVKELGEELINYLASDHSGLADQHSHYAVLYMLAYTVFIGAIFIWISSNNERLAERFGEEHVDKVEQIGGMSLAWCVATASKWTTYALVQTSNNNSVYKSITVRKLLDAAWVTPAMVVLVIGMDALADRGLFADHKAESVISVCGLVTGIAWEQCFASATITVSEGFPGPAATIQSLITLVLLVALVPGWLKYFVPKAREPTPKRELEVKDDAALASVKET